MTHARIDLRRSLLAMFVAVSTLSAPALAQGLPHGFHEAFQPELTRRDMSTLAEVLQLKPDRYAIVEALLEDYVDGVEAGEKAVRESMVQFRPQTSVPDGEQQKAQLEMRETIRALRDTAQNDARATDDPEERRRILEAFQNRVRELQSEMQASMTDDSDDAEQSVFLAKLSASLEAWEASKSRLYEQFVTNLLAILDEEQLQRWPVVERRLRREKTLPRGQLSGESVNLIELVGRLELDGEARSGLAETLTAYELRLDAALVARNATLRETRYEQAEALRDGDQVRVMALVDRQIDAEKRVREVNEEFMLEIASRLPSGRGQAFIDLVNARAFTRVYRPTRTSRVLAAAARLYGLPDEQRSAVETLLAGYTEQITATNARLRELTRRHEPAQLRLRYERVSGGAARGEDLLRQAFVERRALDDEFLAQLRGLLSDDEYRRAARGSGGDRTANGE